MSIKKFINLDIFWSRCGCWIHYKTRKISFFERNFFTGIWRDEDNWSGIEILEL